MMTAELFRNHPRIAATCRKHGRDWLSLMRDHVRQMAVERGITIGAINHAICVDLGEHEPSPPASPLRVDVVMPFCKADARYLAECLQSIIDQRHVIPTVHVINDGNDGAEWPSLPVPRPAITVHRYETEGGWGPYRITNSIVQHGHCESEYLALQDADDTSDPDRLWRQIQTLKATGADMISSAYRVFVQPDTPDPDGVLQGRLRWEPICRPGRKFDHVNPLGRLVNSSRTMTLESFRRLNGFADMFCTGDFEYDNRARFAGLKIIDDQTILGARRLHSGSLTGGPYREGTGGRSRDTSRTIETAEIMATNPTIEQAAEFGKLHAARHLLSKATTTQTWRSNEPLETQRIKHEYHRTN